MNTRPSWLSDIDWQDEAAKAICYAIVYVPLIALVFA